MNADNNSLTHACRLLFPPKSPQRRARRLHPRAPLQQQQHPGQRR
jgi:hypothetical protein